MSFFASLAAALGLVPVPVGVGPAFRPAPGASAAGGLTCTRRVLPRYGVHLELFRDGRAVVVPAGIGIAPPLHRDGAYVRGGACSFPVRTREPTGLVEVARGSRLTLGDLLAVWGHGISPGTRVYVNGHRWAGNGRAVPLRRHAEIVLEDGAFVQPHSFYAFPKGL